MPNKIAKENPMQNKQNLVLIDGYAQIYRGFYGIRNLTNSQGEPTNAIYAIARFLLKLESMLKYQYASFVLDKGKSQKRLAIHPTYKSTRKPMPDELRSQIPYIRQWVEAFGYTIIEQQGQEADDLIGAIVYNRENHPTYIVSGDKDLTQLISEQVFMIIAGSKGQYTIWDKQAVIKKFGIPPKLIVDYLALIGDTADAIPGIAGVGPKTALKLLLEYQNIDNLLENHQSIKNEKLREKLANSKQLLTLNRKLINLDLTLPDNWQGVQSLKRKRANWNLLLELCDKHNFKSLKNTIYDARNQERNPTLF